MKNLIICIQSILLLGMMSSCSVYNSPLIVSIDKETALLLKQGRTSNTGNAASDHSSINNNYTWNIVAEDTKVPPATIAPPAVTPVTKTIIKQVKVGCSRFVMPELLESIKLTGDMIKAKSPKTPQDINKALLDNIEQNQLVYKENKVRLEKAYSEHFKSCRS